MTACSHKKTWPMAPAPRGRRTLYLPLRMKFRDRPASSCSAWKRVSSPSRTRASASSWGVGGSAPAARRCRAYSSSRGGCSRPLLLTCSRSCSAVVGGGMLTPPEGGALPVLRQTPRGDRGSGNGQDELCQPIFPPEAASGKSASPPDLEFTVAQERLLRFSRLDASRPYPL